MCRALVPAYFWAPDEALIKYRATTFRGKQLSGAAQRQWVKKLGIRVPRKAPTVVIGSDPTDNGALYTAYYMLSQYIKTKGRDVAVLNAANYVTRMETYPGCAVIHNILNKATDERAQQVRDLCNRFLHTFKLVVIGGATDPEKWMVTRAGIYPDVVLRVKDLPPEELRRNG